MQKITAVLVILFCVSLIISDRNDYRLILLAENDISYMNISEVETLIQKKVEFMDITNYPVPHITTQPKLYIPHVLRFQKQVHELASKISTEILKEHIQQMSSIFTRYYKHPGGIMSSRWVAGKLNSIQNNSAIFFPHKDWPQNSVIAKIPGSGPAKNEIVILGAHLDSINSTNASSGRAPGADDDASGVAAILEIFRVLIQSGWKPNRTIEFHAYSAEEVGLLGSQDIANQYAARGVPVAGMLMFDQTSWKGKNDVVGILTDFVDLDLTSFLRKVVREYSGKTMMDLQCGRPCTDSASWHRSGYPACHVAEAAPFSETNPYRHTIKDTLDVLDVEHGKELAKIGLGFATELAG